MIAEYRKPLYEQEIKMLLDYYEGKVLVSKSFSTKFA